MEISSNGNTGNYFVSGSGLKPLNMVTVFYEGRKKSTQKGGLDVETIATMLLNELVQERERADNREVSKVVRTG